MSFHFASSEYTACFQNLPTPDTDTIRKNTLEYLKTFNKEDWYNDPVTSLVNGQKLVGSAESKVTTLDALGQANGSQYFATPEQVKVLKDHISLFKSPYTDLREPIRRIEQKLLSTHAGLLVGNQCIDFQKQDGITEMEEAVMANCVERKLNDLLLRDATDNVLSINRNPIYVSCVSNFTNFLDLFRKTIRNLEVGTPCIVLGRSNTVQHSYRWTELLSQLLQEENIDPGMLTYLSCSLNDIIDITQSCQEYTGNLYATCSRELAHSIKSGYPNTVASTGGPNTLLTTEWTGAVQDAIRMSATIESSGQCTALRHAIVPKAVQQNQVEELFLGIQGIANAPTALERSMFDGVFANHAGTPTPKTPYSQVHDKSAYYIVSDELPKPGIHEYWRQVVVDFSKLDASSNVDDIASWLNENQPISLAVNAPRQEAFKLGFELFEKTGLVVNTIGSTDDPKMPPALTCQARPQEAEVFGEFPPRRKLKDFTEFPVVVPSSTPAYDAHYTHDYLTGLDTTTSVPDPVQPYLNEVSSGSVKGYCVVLLNYIKDVTKENPKRGFGTSRTAVWGLQKPPTGTTTYLRCLSDTEWDDIVATVVLFQSTTAAKHLQVSIDPANHALIATCQKVGLDCVVVESESAFGTRSSAPQDNVVFANTVSTAFPSVGQFVSVLLPLGHLKSTMVNDEEFVAKAKTLEKWLQMNV